MSGSSEFEEFMHFWFAEYYSSGRDKHEIVKLLKSYPNAASFLVDEIVEQLQVHNKRYLGKKTDVKVEIRHQDIVDFFNNGPNWFHDNDYPAEKEASANHVITEWKKQSYDEKMFHLTVAYPEYSRQYLAKIISQRNKTYPD